MYFLAGKYKTGWFTLGTDLYHFDSNGLAHKLTVLEDQKTTCGTQGHKTVKCECGEVYTARYARPAGHDFVPHTDADGSACYKCTFCGLISTINVPFLDVSDKAWYAKDVEYAYQNGCINGTSALTFSPNDFLTREQMVTILWRIAGEPGYENVDKTYFSDVKINAYSTAAINWAYENEIVLGTGDGKFRPRDNVLRMNDSCDRMCLARGIRAFRCEPHQREKQQQHRGQPSGGLRHRFPLRQGRRDLGLEP